MTTRKMLSTFAVAALLLPFVRSTPAADLAARSRAPKVVFKGKSMDAFLAFGNSYTFIQGTKGYWGFSFLGDAFNATNITATDVLTDRIVKNVTSSGGPNWVEYLTGCYEGLPRHCPGSELWDLAYAGADISTDFLPQHHPETIQFDEQIYMWDSKVRSVINLPTRTTLVANWIGINDIGDSAKQLPANATAADWAALFDTYMVKYFSLMDLIYSRGFRNFLFNNLPPREKTALDSLRYQLFNDALAAHVEAFRKRHSSWLTALLTGKLEAVLFDAHTFLLSVLANPAAYDIKITDTFCKSYAAPDINWNYAAYNCSNLGDYFWLNSGHITYTTHKALAAELKRVIK